VDVKNPEVFNNKTLSEITCPDKLLVYFGWVTGPYKPPFQLCFHCHFEFLDVSALSFPHSPLHEKRLIVGSICHPERSTFVVNREFVLLASKLPAAFHGRKSQESLSVEI